MTPPTPQEAEIAGVAAELARGLTKAQRKAIKQAVWNDEFGEWRAFAMHPADKNLRAKGLATGLWAILTPLGLAVRAHLQRAQGER
jgi:hypothetical protein